MMLTSVCCWLLRGSSAAVVLLLFSGCGPDPNGPGSYQDVVNSLAKAEESLKSQAVKAERKDYPPYGSAWVVDLSGKPLTPEIWTALRGLGYISELNLSGTTFGDADVPTINELSGFLINLNASGTALTDQGLAQLDAPHLRQLDVTNTKVTAEGVSSFQKARKENPKIAQGFKNVQVKR